MGSCCGKKEETKTDLELNGTKLLEMSRFPTDPLMLLIYVAFSIGMFAIMIYAFAVGQPDRLMYGTDWTGTACGAGDDDFNQFWPNPVFYDTLGSICLNGCPGATWNSTEYPATGIYCHCNAQLVANLTAANGILGTYDFSTIFTSEKSNIKKQCDASSNRGYAYWTADQATAAATSSEALSFRTSEGGGVFDGTPNSYLPLMTGYYWYKQTLADGNSKAMMPICNYAYSTNKALNRCVPDSTAIDSLKTYVCAGDAACGFGTFDSYIHVANNVLTTGMADMITCWYVILCSFLIAILLGFVYLILMQYCAMLIVWVMLLLVNLLLIVTTAAFCYYYTVLEDKVDAVPQMATHDTDQDNMYICLAFAIVFGLMELIVFCMCVCMCTQIQTAIHLVQLAATAIKDMPLLLLYPIMNVLVLGLWSSLWIAVAVFLASTGEQVEHAVYGYFEWHYTTEVEYAVYYWVFGFLWTCEYMMAASFTMLAFCICVWFFTEEEADGDRKLSNYLTRKVIWTTLTKFGGTLATGSLIIAIIQTLRLLLEYIQQKKDEFTAGKVDPGCFWNFLFTCLKCCLACVESCLKWVNKNVYIETILRNSWFCTGVCHVATVVFHYLDYITVTKPIAAGLLWSGKAAITFGTAGFGAYWAASLDVGSIVLPTLMMMFIGFGVATSFTEVFSVAVDTMLLCFCEADYNNQRHTLPKCFKEKDGNNESPEDRLDKAKQAKTDREAESETKTIDPAQQVDLANTE